MHKSFKTLIIAAIFILYLAFISSISYSQDISKNSFNEAFPVNDKVMPRTSSNDSILAGTPQIYIPDDSYDFGSIKQGSKVSHTFKVYNKGDAPLKLIKAKGS